MESNCAESPVPSHTVLYNWVDISNEFFDNIKELSLGELLHDEMFGLFDAMSAIEMMDPKMDAGMVCNRGHQPLTFDAGVQSGKIKLADLSSTEVVGVIDRCLCCLVAWLEGHSLAQTVFTCLYMHKPYQILEKNLKAVCIALYKILDLIRDFVNNGDYSRANVCEEEDFQPMAYGYKLQPDMAESKVIALLKECEDDLQKKIRANPEEYILALHSRVKFTRLFYLSLLQLSRFGQNQSHSQSSNSVNTNVSEVQKTLGCCLELIPIINKTLIIVPEVPAGDDPMGFSPLVNQRLLPPTFPRYTRIPNATVSFGHFEGLLQRLKSACRITTCTGFHSALDFFLEFSRRAGPCLLSRCVLQTLYTPASLQEALKDSVRNFIAPPSLVPRSPILTNQEAKDCLDTFFSYCVRPFASLLQLCGHNRARQRDKLARLIEDFSSLQDEAERVDAFLHQLTIRSEIARTHLACLGTWVLYHCLRLIAMYLLSGLELELYSVHEYHYIFWYLYEFLYGWMVSALSRADNYLSEQPVTEAPRGGKGSRKKPKKRKTRPYGREILINQAMQNMCGGYYKALFGFQVERRIPIPQSPFDSEKVRYEHRMSPLSVLATPPPVQYSEFQEIRGQLIQRWGSNDNNGELASELYASAAKHFHQARSLLETIAVPDTEITDILKVAKTNFIVVKLLAGGHKRNSTPPEFDFSMYRHLPIIKLT